MISYSRFQDKRSDKSLQVAAQTHLSSSVRWSVAVRLLAIILFLIGESSLALDIACDDTLEDEISSADVIVAGDVFTKSVLSSGEIEVVFRVLRQWKGDPIETMTLTFRSPDRFDYEESGFYLIYANSFGSLGERHWGLRFCNGVSDIAYEGERLKLLEGWSIDIEQ